MLPLNHKRTRSSLGPTIFYAAKKIGTQKMEGSPFVKFRFIFFKKKFFYKSKVKLICSGIPSVVVTWIIPVFSKTIFEAFEKEKNSFNKFSVLGTLGCVDYYLQQNGSVQEDLQGSVSPTLYDHFLLYQTNYI